MTSAAETIAGGRSQTAIFDTNIAVTIVRTLNITAAAVTGVGAGPAACSITASFASWCWP